MIRRLSDPDILGGLFLTAFGLVFAAMATRYTIGNLQEMGPGMFPMIVGVLITVSGIAVALRGFSGHPTDPALPAEYPDEPDTRWHHVRAMLFVCGGILLFGLVIPIFGLVPAIVTLVLVMRLADSDRNPITTLAIASGLSIVAWLIFIWGLNMNVPAFQWGF
jgi:hypothetical protein